MNYRIALAGLGAALIVVGTRRGGTVTRSPGVPQVPTGYVPTGYVPPLPTVYVPPAGVAPPAQPAALAQVVGRVIAAASTLNPATMRAEALLLRAEGWPDHANDLEELARRTEALRVTPTPSPAPKPPVAAPAPVVVSTPPFVPPYVAPAALPPFVPAVVPPYVPYQPPAPAALPTPAPIALPPSSQVLPAIVAAAGAMALPDLKVGDKGNAVTAWQEILRADGHKSLPATGNFMAQTRKTTAYWMVDRGWDPNVFSGDVVNGQVRALALIPPRLGPRLLTQGSEGGAVKVWQNVLVASGQTQVVVDGVYGIETVNATKFWQAARKLEADGSCGPKTVAALNQQQPGLSTGSLTALAAAAAAAVPITTAAVTAAVGMLYSTTIDPTKWRNYLQRGSVGKDVEEWQTVLSRDGFVQVPDGQFGPGTETATKSWQKSRGLTPQDGVVGPDCRAKIVLPKTSVVAGFELQDVPFRALQPSAPLPGMPLLVPTEVVAPERALASKLALNLFFAGEGAEDRDLVTLFQNVNGLNATGSYGPGTAEALIAYGIVPPKPRAWPSKGSLRVRARYRAALQAQARRDPQRAVEWNAAARAVEQ